MAMALAMIMGVTTITGCSSKTESAGKTQVTEVPTLQLMIPSHPSFPYDEEWSVVKSVEEATGVNLEVQAILNSGSSFDEKLNLTMVGDKLPDLIFPINNNAVKKYGDDGAFINILDHMDKLPNFSKWYEENKESVVSFLSADGSLYQFPSMGAQESNRRAWLYREDIFAKHDLKVPTTSEELYEVLKELKTIYPDSYPLAFRSELSQFDNIAPAWGTSYVTANRHMNIDENGEFVFGPVEDNFKEMLEFFNQLYEEELIIPNFLSIDTNGWQELMSNDRSFITIDYISRIDFFNGNLEETNPEFNLAYMPPFAGGTNGQAMLPDTRVGFYGNIITSQTKNLDAALAYCDWWYSDEAIELTSWGIEGEQFEVVDGEKQWINYKDQTEMKLDSGLATYGFYQIYDFDASKVLSSPELKDAYDQAEQYDLKMQPILAFNEEEQKIVETTVESLKSYVAESISKFMTSQMDFSEWDNYVNTVNSMGLDEMTRIHTEAYARLTQ